MSESIFQQVYLPNATTWFYLSVVMIMALFARFSRPFSLRNWDLVILFLLVPAFLYLRESQERRRVAETAMATCAAEVAGRSAALTVAAAVGGSTSSWPLAEMIASGRTPHLAYERATRSVWFAFLGLLLGSAVWLGRCLLDLELVRRPPFVPNLAPSGLIWLALILFMVLSGKTILQASADVPVESTQSLVLEKATTAAESAAQKVNEAVARDRWTAAQLQVREAIAIGCQLLVVVAMLWIGIRHFQNVSGAIGAVVLYLFLPYTAYYGNAIQHVLPGALLTMAAALYRSPLAAGAVMGLAAGTVYFPVLLVPLWLGLYRGGGAVRFLTAFLAAIVLIAIAYLWLGGDLPDDLRAAIVLPDWRAWDLAAVPSREGLWAGVQLHYAYRAPLFVAYLVLIASTAFWLAPKNLAHLLALSTALILGIQFWYADHGGIYVLWYLPLLILLVIRPNLSEHYPPRFDREADWFSRIGYRLGARLRRRRGEPLPSAPPPTPDAH